MSQIIPLLTLTLFALGMKNLALEEMHVLSQNIARRFLTLLLNYKRVVVLKPIISNFKMKDF